MDDVVLIGVDGGATKVLVHRVEILTNPLRFAPMKPMIEVGYESSENHLPKFKPVALATQLAQHKAKKIEQGKDEAQQESAILESFSRAISTLLPADDHSTFILGVGLPGLKTPNKRGISAMANGPRMPQFLSKLEKMLKKQGYSTLHPIHAIGSDADYCGLGEHWGDEGAMREVENAYYLGVGTGVADALLLNNAIIPFDEVKAWIPKTWEMMYNDEESFEDLISAQGIQERYAAATQTSLDELNAEKIFPWQIFERALEGQTEAVAVVNDTCAALSELLFLRITSLAQGNTEIKLIDKKRKLSSDHDHQGKTFERIVIGQRLGDIWQFRDFDSILREPVENTLGRRLHESEIDAEIKSSYLTNTNRLRDDLIVSSELRHAPALGAAVDAYLNWIK